MALRCGYSAQQVREAARRAEERQARRAMWRKWGPALFTWLATLAAVYLLAVIVARALGAGPGAP